MIEIFTHAGKQYPAFRLKQVLGQLLLILLCAPVFGQVTLSTTGAVTNTETAAAITFNFQNTNSYPVILTDIAGILADYGDKTVEIWYKPSAINGVPGAISTANGWISAATANVTGIQNLSSVITQPLFSGLALSIPANSTYGLAIMGYSGTAGALRIGTVSGTVAIPGGGCNILTGAN